MATFSYKGKKEPPQEVYNEHIQVGNLDEGIFKAFIPNFLYKPPYGMPRRVNLPQLKALAKNPYVFSVIKTLADEVTSLGWEVKVKKEFQEEGKDFKDKIKESTGFFRNPNGNEESFNHILRQVITDIEEIDSGIIVKVFNIKGEMKQIFSRDGGCLRYGQMIETEKGMIPIGQLVKDKDFCKVKTWNVEKEKIEWKSIVAHRCSGTSANWYKIKAVTNRKFRTLTGVTHNIPTPDGKKLIEDLNVGDVIYTQQDKLNDIQRQIILGSLLGDGSLKKGNSEHAKYYFCETHCEKQKDYLLWKFDNLQSFNPVYREYMSAYSDDYEPTLKCQFKTKADNVFSEFVDLKYPKFKSNIVNELDVLGLAVWLQDDGYMYHYGGIEISSHSMDKDVQLDILNILKDKFGFEGKLGYDKRCDKWFMRFNKENSLKIIELIKNYIHPCMEYKFKVKGSPPIDYKTELSLVETEIYEINKIKNIDSKYDIEVEGNHNYFAQGILVNNTFLKNPDIYGYIGNRAEFVAPLPDGFSGVAIDVGGTPTVSQQQLMKQYSLAFKERAAYYQYGWTAGSLPVPFGKREIVYFMQNPRGDSIYGRSPIEILTEVILNLIYGVDFNLDFYVNNNMPEGVISLLGAQEAQLKQFRENFENQFRFKDSLGYDRKKFFSYPLTTTEVKFTPFTLNAEEMQIIAQQEWFTKVLWMCMTEDTEILTEDGWTLFKYLKDEKVARYNIENKEIDFIVPEDKQVLDYDGEMIRFVNRNIDLKVTPEHRMLYQTRDKFERNIPFEIAKAKDLFNKHSCIVIPQAGKYKGNKLNNKVFGDVEFTGEQFSKFMGFWLGDGWANTTDNRVEFAVSKVCYPEVYNKITDLFKEVGIEWKENEYIPRWTDKPMITLRYSNKELNQYLKQFGKAKTKYIPSDILNSTSQEMISFLEYYEMADGCSEKYGKNKRFFSMSKELINGCQEMYVKLGIASNINEWNNGYELSVRKSKIDRNKDFSYVYKNSIIKENYKGKVYDVTVPKQHNIIVRRNGRICITGNCFGVNADEMGYTETSNKSVGEKQEKAFKRKAIRPLVDVLEYHINTQIMPEFFSTSGKEMTNFRDVPLEFKFDTYDSDEDMIKHNILEKEINMGVKTPEMAAKELGINVEELVKAKEKAAEKQMEMDKKIGDDEGDPDDKKDNPKDNKNPKNNDKKKIGEDKALKAEEPENPFKEIDKHIDGIGKALLEAVDMIPEEQFKE